MDPLSEDEKTQATNLKITLTTMQAVEEEVHGVSAHSSLTFF